MGHDRDQELDDLLRPLAERHTSPASVQRWSKAVELAAKIKPRAQSPWLLLAAMLVGFIMGAMAMRIQSQHSATSGEKVAESIYSDDATIVQVTSKSY